MILSASFPSRYFQGPGLIKKLSELSVSFGNKPLLLCSPTILNNVIPELTKAGQSFSNFVIEGFNRECSWKEIERIEAIAKENSRDFIIGFGGGKVMDTARIVADRLSLPMAVIPSIASTDAPTASVSVVYTESGVVQDIIAFKKNPDLVLVDTEIIVKSPVRYLVAGMGDGLATWFEAAACEKNHAKNIAGNNGTLTAFAIAKLCCETILHYGYEAKLSNEAGVVTPAFEHIVEANTLMSGLGFENGGLGTSHAIHNGFTVLPATKKYYHGEKVALGLLVSLFLTDKSVDVIDELYDFCEKIGLPTTLAEIGIGDATKEELFLVAERACQKGDSMFNEMPDATPEKVYAAIVLADTYGRDRK
jgi:glycerol dehydrogenase